VRREAQALEKRAGVLESENAGLRTQLDQAHERLRTKENEAQQTRVRQALAQANLDAAQSVVAVLDTNYGTMKVRLAVDKAPFTVANFVGLAEGTRTWIDPKSGKENRGVPYYNGLTFHRVIKDFMIQGGDPLGEGTGGPGYQFPDEFHPDLRHNKVGTLSMANAGPGTNGSQFFLTLKPTSHLDAYDSSGQLKACGERGVSCHAVFGELIEGQDVLEKIGSVAVRKPDNRPLEPVIIKKVTIVRESA
jgi:cyclophilin family peptidyl-prolyl cis-trans isomerase